MQTVRILTFDIDCGLWANNSFYIHQQIFSGHSDANEQVIYH